MEIKISEKNKKTLNDVPIGDLFVSATTAGVYFKSAYTYQGAIKCYSVRTGNEYLFDSNMPVSIVKSVSIELEE